MTHFTKTPDGGWAFEANSRTFEARRNEAGFGGRDWDLFEVDFVDGHLAGRRGIADQFASRADAAAHAEWLGAGVDHLYESPTAQLAK